METQNHERYRFGLFEVDLSGRGLYKRGVNVHLQEKPFLILAMLLRRPGQLVTRAELRNSLWAANTFVEFNDGLNTAIGKLRGALGDSAEQPAFIETVRGKGYRFIATIAKEESNDGWQERRLDSAKAENIAPLPIPKTNQWRVLAIAILCLLIVGSMAMLSHGRRASSGRLTEKDTLLVAEFANSTEDPVFDDSLREALTTQLEQSPFLSLVPARTVQETLPLMGKPANTRINPELASDLCHRVASKGIVSGSISHVGREYVIALNATACETGESLGREEARTSNKDDVLKSLDSVATKLRSHLGESLSSIQKFETPIEQATTSSLEALRAFSHGRQAMNTENWAISVPWFQQAIRIDPNFAMAYALLGNAYWNMGELNAGAENTKIAYSLRGRVSEHERWYLESHYYQIVLRDLEKARMVYEVWGGMYPRDLVPRHNPGDIYMQYGHYEKALATELEALRVDPNNGYANSNLVLYYLSLERLQDAENAAKQAEEKHLESALAGTTLYFLAFMHNDEKEMERQMLWAKNNPGNEDWMLSLASDTAAYRGELSRARELSANAVTSAMNAHERETAANWRANEALREAEFGNRKHARQAAKEALRLFPGIDAQSMVAMTYARIGETDQAQRVIDALKVAHPNDTMLEVYWRPLILSAVALQQGKPAEGVELLQQAAPFELGATGPTGQVTSLYPAYLRGEAYLAMGKPKEAAKEFHKYLEHRGAVKNCPLGALALMKLAHAHVLSGDISAAQAEYDRFFELWRTADRDLTIFRQANAEHATIVNQ